MNVIVVKAIARQHNIKPGRMSKEDLIRAIQQNEGNFTCFNTDSSKMCGQEQCLWRADCV